MQWRRGLSVRDGYFTIMNCYLLVWPGLSGDGRDSKSYWYDLFAGCTIAELWDIGNFLFRYCSYLGSKGLSY